MPEFPDTNYSLIDRVRNPRDGDSWIEFLGIYQPVVYRIARRRGMQDADAQDIVQQVFTSIARSLDSWTASDDLPPFRAWLTTIARNAISTALVRRPRDQATGSSSVAEVLGSLPSPEQVETEWVVEIEREIVRWAAEQIRPEFTDQTWDIFWKTAMLDVTVAEISKLTGRSTGAIYVARHRVLARLKEKIAEISVHWELPESKQ